MHHLILVLFKNCEIKWVNGKLTNPIIDTLQLSRLLQQQLRYHRLGTVVRKYNIKYNEEIAHRADYDAEILAAVFAVMLTDLEDNYQVKTLLDILDFLQN